MALKIIVKWIYYVTSSKLSIIDIRLLIDDVLLDISIE